MNVVVYGLWHLGCVTAGCVAAAGNRVVGVDADGAVVEGLRAGTPPIHEPGLTELLASETKSGRLTFTTDAAKALRGADVLWVTFDTPVDENDVADVDFVRRRLDAVASSIPPECVVLISSQVPAGFTGELRRAWDARGLRRRYAYSPENLRLGKAIEVFRNAERVVLGVSDESAKPALEELFAPFTKRIEWMTVESAEMTKHALNAFLATSVTFANELARLCEAVGADAREVERGLKSEARIGPKAYLSPGAAFAGGTLARDVRFLTGFGERHHLDTPLLSGVLASNEAHKDWVRRKVSELLGGATRGATVAVLGLTYKPGTDTLRRSLAVELCRWLHGQGAHVRAHDPAVRALPQELTGVIDLKPDVADALAGADVAVVATEWPDYRSLRADDFNRSMRRARVVDPNWFLAAALADAPGVTYVATGRGGALSSSASAKGQG
jgi:UDPglucose 6-dehydrogenase